MELDFNQQEGYYAVPFSIVGLFVTNKEVEESIREEITPEELERLQDIVAKMLFKSGVSVALYPGVVPPDQAVEAVNELEELIMGEGEE